MKATGNTVLIDVRFNADSKQLEQVVADAEGKPIVKKIELDRGSLEGPLKDFKEFTAKLSEGGAEKGIGQITKAFSSFKSVAASGGDIFTSLGAGMGEIGVEAGAVVQGIAAIGTATVVATTVAVAAVGLAVTAFGSWLSTTDQQQRLLAGAGAGFADYSANVRGAADMTQFLALKNAALSAGFVASGKDLAAVVNSMKTYAEATGNAATAEQLHTQALSGNIEAARRLGVVVDEYATAQQVAAASTAHFTAEQEANRTVMSSIAEVWEKFGADLNTLWEALKDVIGLFVLFTPITVILLGVGYAIAKITSGLAAGVRAVKEWIASFDLTGVGAALNRVRDQELQLETHRRMVADNRRRDAQNQIADANVAFDNARREFGLLTGAATQEDAATAARQRRIDMTERLAEAESDLIRANNNPLTTDAERTSLMRARTDAQVQLNDAARIEIDYNSRSSQTQRAIAAAARDRLMYEQGISQNKPQQLNFSEMLSRNERSIAATQHELLTATGARRGMLLKTIDDLLRERGIITETRDVEVDRVKREREAAAQRAQAAAASARQLADAVLQLQLTNAINTARGATLNNNLRAIDLAQTEENLMNRIARIDMRHPTQAVVDLYSRLNGQLTNIRDTRREIAELNPEVDEAPFETTNRLIRSTGNEMGGLAERMQGAGDIFNEIGGQQTAHWAAQMTTARAIRILQGEVFDSENMLLDRALQKREQGLALSSREQDALTREASIRAMADYSDQERMRRVAEINTELLSSNTTQERRNELLAERNRLEAEHGDHLDLIFERQQRQQANNNKFAESLIRAAGGYKTIGQNATEFATGALSKMGTAMSSIISDAIDGEKSFSEAAASALRAMLVSLSQESAVQALYQSAVGFGKLAIGDAAGAGNAFASAALFAGVATAAGFGAAALPKDEKKGAKDGAAKAYNSDSEQYTPTERNVVVNINTRPFDTAENIEDAIYRGVRSAQRRRGER